MDNSNTPINISSKIPVINHNLCKKKTSRYKLFIDANKINLEGNFFDAPILNHDSIKNNMMEMIGNTSWENILA